MNKTPLNDSYLGMKAIKKYGYFSSLVGIIEKSNGMTDYCLKFKPGYSTSISFLEDIELVEVEME